MARDNRINTDEIFRLLVEGVSDYAIFVLNPEGLIQTWNTGARRLKGYDAIEVIGTHFSRFYTPEDIARDHPKWELEQASQNGRYEEEGWRVRKDGSRFWANVIITAIRDKQARLLGYSKVTRDLTERKKSEESLKDAYASLERRVQERTRELASAKEQAERAVRTRDEFLSIASHELRTPLTSLKLKSQMAKRWYRRDAELSQEAEKFQSFIFETDEQLDRVVKLVEDMLDLTRISQGVFAMSPVRVDLCGIAQNVVERMAAEFHAKHTPIEFRGCADALVLVDPFRMEQVVSNLLTNVLRYAYGKPVQVEVVTDQEVVRLSVQDQGPGIDKEKHQQIFDRYERLDSSAGVAGLGIGLYLSRMIVNAHSGSISVESDQGKGARFIVELPRDKS
jgi:PAS domain S-box-containing protein